eukprot:5254082-Prymnesium_polylepis.1
MQLALESDVDEEIAKLDTRSESGAHSEHAVTGPQPAKHGRLESHLLRPIVGHADADERLVRLGSHAVHIVPEGWVRAAFVGRQRDFRLHVLLRQGER